MENNTPKPGQIEVNTIGFIPRRTIAAFRYSRKTRPALRSAIKPRPQTPNVETRQLHQKGNGLRKRQLGEIFVFSFQQPVTSYRHYYLFVLPFSFFSLRICWRIFSSHGWKKETHWVSCKNDTNLIINFPPTAPHFLSHKNFTRILPLLILSNNNETLFSRLSSSFWMTQISSVSMTRLMTNKFSYPYSIYTSYELLLRAFRKWLVQSLVYKKSIFS